MLITEQQLIDQASEVLRNHGCEAAGLGPNGYQYSEFGHVYGPTIIIKPTQEDISADALDRINREIVKKMSGVCGVSLDAAATSVGALKGR